MQSCYNTPWKCDGRETLTHGAVPWAGDSDACMPSAPHHGLCWGGTSRRRVLPLLVALTPGTRQW